MLVDIEEDGDDDVLENVAKDAAAEAADAVVVLVVIKLDMVLHAICIDRCNDSISRNSG